MKLNYQSTYLKYLLLITTGVTTLMLTACSSLAPVKEPISETEACSRLNELIADHPNKFVKHKKNKRPTRRVTIWSATAPFPTANNCEVWEWSSGLHGFVCDWIGKDGMESAKADYQEAQQIIRNCLSEPWQAESHSTTSGGQNTVYSKVGSKTIVSIRYFQETNSIMKNWHTVLYIGDRSNLKAKVK